MNRRKYILSTLGIGAGIGLSYKYNMQPTIASDISLNTNKKQLEATTRIIDSESAKINFEEFTFTINPINFFNETPKFDIIGKTTTQGNTQETTIIENEEINGKTDIKEEFDLDTIQLPLNITEEGENIPVEIEFIIKPTNYDIDSFYATKEIQLTVVNDFEATLISDDSVEVNEYADYAVDPVDDEYEEEDLDILWTFNGEEPEDDTFQGSLSISKRYFEEGDVLVVAEVTDPETGAEATLETTTTVTESDEEISEPHESEPDDISEVLSNMEGSGSSSDPYKITDDHELQAMNASTGSHYELTRNIDASLTDGWNNENGFNPIETINGFNGNGYDIRGLTIDRPNMDNVGLFRATDDNSMVENVRLVDITVKGGDSQVAALIGGRAQDSVGDIRNIGIINADVESGSGTHHGLITGRSSSSQIEKVFAIGGELNTNGSQVGGLVGRTTGSTNILDSYARVSVIGDGDEIGGIVGTTSNADSDFERIYSAGFVENKSGSAGGLFGEGDGGDSFGESYWDVETSNQDNSEGDAEGLEPEKMTGDDAEDNMSGFDFENVWAITTGYPELRDNPE